MGVRGFFDDLAGAAERSIFGLPAEKESDNEKYLNLISKVFRTLSDIHVTVTDLALDVGEAEDLEEAGKILKVNEGEKGGFPDLADIFRVQHLCQELRETGSKLRPFIEKRTNLSDEDRQALHSLSTAFEAGEASTANLYDSKLYDIRRLVENSQNAGSLTMLRGSLENIVEELAMQKAKFDLLVGKAQAKLRRMQ